MTSAPRRWMLRATPSPWPGTPPFLVDGTVDALGWLRAAGFVPGNRIGVISPNRPALAALIGAAGLAGCTLVLINHRLAPGERAALHARLALTAVLAGDAAGLALPGAQALPGIFPPVGATPAPTPLADDAPALVVATSGSSAAPKLVRLSAGALRAAATAAVARLGLDRACTWLTCLPLDHIGGAMTVLRAAWSGCALALHERFAVDAVDADVAVGASGLGLVPTMLHRLVVARGTRPWPATLRLILVGGAPLADDLATACARLGLAASASYGLSEAGSQVCTLLPHQARGGVGWPLPGIDVRVCATTGVIAVRGAGLFSGYEEHGEVVAPHASGAWFVTGDLGRIDADGRVHVLGRADEVLISGGEKVSPSEVESVLLGHPAIAEAAVCGLPDAQWGALVGALLVAAGEPPDDVDFADWLARHLSAFKRPRRWRWVAALPRGALGKLQRGALPALLAGTSP